MSLGNLFVGCFSCGQCPSLELKCQLIYDWEFSLNGKQFGRLVVNIFLTLSLSYDKIGAFFPQLIK